MTDWIILGALVTVAWGFFCGWWMMEVLTNLRTISKELQITRHSVRELQGILRRGDVGQIPGDKTKLSQFDSEFPEAIGPASQFKIDLPS